MTLRMFFNHVLTISFSTFHLSAYLTLQAALPARFQTFIATCVSVFKQRGVSRLTRRIFRRNRYLFVTNASRVIQCTPLNPCFVQSTHAARIQVDHSDYRLISQGICFKSSHSRAFLNMDSRITSFILHVRRTFTVQFTIVFTKIATSSNFLTLHPSLNRFQVFLSLSTPSLIIYRIPIRTIRVIRNGGVSRLLSQVCQRRIPKGVRIRATVQRAQVIISANNQGLSIRSFNRNKSELARNLRTVRGANIKYSNSLSTILTSRRTMTFQIPSIKDG